MASGNTQKQGQKAVKELWRSLTPRQRKILVIAAAVLLVLCFVLERAGVWDRLLEKTGQSSPAYTPVSGTLEAHFMDVGNADAALVLCDGTALLIDGGERDDGDTIVEYLRAHGVEKLDYIIATHPDADHIGGLRTVVNSVPVEQFLMAYMPEGHEPTTSTYLNLLAALDEQNIPVTDVAPGTVYALGEAAMTILGPVADAEDTNEQSVVCRITHGENNFLFVGDAGEEEETALLNAGVNLRADVLKVGHHGSRGSSTARFLEAVGARYGIISCGEGNSYGHPHDEAVKRLQNAGLTLYRTDQSGTVVIVSDGKELTIKTER